VLYLRYGEFHQMSRRPDRAEHGAAGRAGRDPAGRATGRWRPAGARRGPGPGRSTGDGLLFSPQDAAESARSLALTLAMQASLGAYDDTLGAWA
jgi:hypothetical protein